MGARIERRDFLKTTSVAAGALAHAVTGYGRAGVSAQSGQPAEVKISSVAYTPGADYPIQGVRFSRVMLNDTCWKPRVAINAAVTIPLLAERAEGGRGLNGNVLEAAILSIEAHPDARLQAIVEKRIAELRAQPRSGNGGFEVATAYFAATGKRDLLDPAIKAADDLYADFKTNNPPFSGGERDAVNCIQLFRATHDKKHLDLAKHYLDIRGLENSVNRSRHNQSYKPVLEQSEAVGHAVNGVTLMMSMLDVGILTGLKPYADAARRMWLDTVTSKMYVTGGVGSTGNEGFGEPYSLPNISAYSETCAVLMFATFNHKLFLASGDSTFIDVLERGIYNNALSGVSLAGNRFFYVNLYVSSEAPVAIAGQPFTLSVQSEMPWGGRSTIKVSAKVPVKGAIKLRIPGWARGVPAPGTLYSHADKTAPATTISVNGQRVPGTPDPRGYVLLNRQWRDGDTIEVTFPMEVRRVVADARVRECRGRVAIERGPIVYCAEWPETSDRRALALQLDPATELTPEVDQQLLGGVTVIDASVKGLSDPGAQFRRIKLIPYGVWANRGAGEMTVWLSTKEYSVGDTGPAGGLIFYANPNYAADGWRYLEAAPVDQSLGAKWGCFRILTQGARGTAIGTGRQNTADMVAACAERGTAADLCTSYSLNGVGGWFLPSRDELALIYKNLKATGIGDFRDSGMVDNCQYWTSSQQTTDMANHIDFADNGRLHYDDKDFPRRVRAIRAF